MKNCIICYRPISGEAYAIISAWPQPGFIKPHIPTGAQFEYACVRCVEECRGLKGAAHHRGAL